MHILCLPLLLALSSPEEKKPVLLILPTTVGVGADAEAAKTVPSLLQAELSRNPEFTVNLDGQEGACETTPCMLGRMNKAGADQAVQSALTVEGETLWLTVSRWGQTGVSLGSSTRVVTAPAQGGLVHAVRQAAVDVQAPPPGSKTERVWFADLSFKRLAAVVTGSLGMAVSFVAVCVALAGGAIAGGAAMGALVQAYLIWNTPSPSTPGPYETTVDPRREAAYQVSGIFSAGFGTVGFLLLGLLGTVTGVAAASVFGAALLKD